MRFWCSTLEEPWSWTFRAYPGIWVAMLCLVVPYLVLDRRAPKVHDNRGSRRWVFIVAVLLLWVATDWPLGLLGASYLASAHMAQFLIYTMAVAPLLLLGVPEWMARRMSGQLRLYQLVGRCSRPVTAGLVFNAMLISTHSPWLVDNLRVNQFGSFVMDFLWLIGGLVVWMPIASPIPEHRMTSYPGRMVYLFLALGVVPAVPAGFLTFASFPLYATYELAPRVHGLGATTDQQLAGLVMKLGGIPVVWGTIAVLMYRWSEMSRAESAAARVQSTAAPETDNQHQSSTDADQ
ncbi:MAG: cytochrome c oxidase assembly protein [Actinomycetota bacterium]|nr:cytochrome c oxidase assembly protein [Actinomycetota bacterium]